MIILLILSASMLSYGSTDLILIYSSKTQTSLIETFENKIGLYSKHNLNEGNNSILEQILDNAINPLLLDITENSEFFTLLDQISETYETFYLTLTQYESNEASEFRFYLRMDEERHSILLNEMISYLDWKKFSIFFISEYSQIKLSTLVKTEFSSKVDCFTSLFDGVSYDSLNTIVKKTVKASGNRKLLLVGGGNDMNRLQNLIQDRKLEFAGSHFLFSADGIYSAYLNGSIILAYAGTEQSKNESDYKVQIFLNILNKLEGNSLKLLLNNLCEDHICVKELNIVNIQSGKRIIVGSINESLNIEIPIIYPGPTTSKSAFLSSSPLIVSIANGTSEPFVNNTSNAFSNIYKGAEYAVYRSNLYNDIPNFHIELTSTDCGNNHYNKTHYWQCFSKLKEKLGITYLTSYSSVGSYSTYTILESMNITIPQLSPLSSIEELNNKTAFPNLLKIAMSNYDYGESLLLFLLSFNWDSIIFFGSEEPSYRLQYLEYLKIINSIKIKIVNTDDFRLFPETLSREDLKNFTDYFEFAKNSKCRIYFLWTPFSAMILEGLYDVGLRKEDVIIFSGVLIFDSMSEVVEDKYKIKRHEFLPGMNIFTYKEWVGELGEQLYSEISTNTNSETNYLCITYDSISVFKYSINHLLLLGEDYESPDILIKSMRLQRLTGCMGTIFFLRDSNSLANFQVGLGQTQYNETTNNFEISYYATSNKYDTEIIKFTKEIKWPNGENKAPTNFVDFGKCDIDDRIIKQSQNGRNILIIISTIYFTCSLISAFLSSKHYINNLEIIEKGKEPSLSDYSNIFYMPLQFIQIIALGPNKVFTYVGITIQKLIGMNWISLYNLEFFNFWKVLNLHLYFIYLYLFFLIISFRTKQKYFERNYLLSKIKDLIDILLPLIGHYLFIPVFSNLMTIFSCSYSIGDSLEDSYLDRDCKVYCYQNSHLKYSLASGIGIFSYLIISIFIRPYWDFQQLSLNIQTKADYYSAQSIFQVSIVLINSILSMHQEEYIGFTIAGISLLFLIATQFMKPYNYDRGFLIQKVCLCLVIWCMTLESFFYIAELKIVLCSIYFGGILIIAVIGGLFLRRIEDVFKSPKKSDISKQIFIYFCLGSIDQNRNEVYMESEQDVTILENKRQASIGNIVTSQHAELNVK